MTEEKIAASQAQERPLVTFALFAYNQERYIREAVEGALDQDYHPLQIILSDDHSSDNTFEIIKQVVSEYRGPHSVVARRNQKNEGLITHINNVVEDLTSEFVVMAAGDDISLPWRVSAITAVLRADKTTKAVFSDVISFSGSRVGTAPSQPTQVMLKEYPLAEILIHAGGIGIGATYAYHRDCFFWPHTLNKMILSEDRILPLRASLLGRVYYISSPLVYYRQVSNSLTANLIATNRLAHHDQIHWAEVKNTIVQALNKSQIGVVYAYLMIAIIETRNLILRIEQRNEQSKNLLMEIIAWILFIPLRAARKFSKRKMLKIALEKKLTLP